MHRCPSCAAPLDDEGICISCGALARGFFRGLNLGTPQIADAVARGLDFYRLLGVLPTDDVRSVAQRYRQLRVLFPDDPAGLAPEPSRRLALLECAGRVLTDPRLRRIYDELRSGQDVTVTNQVLRCAGCAAPLSASAARCRFCGTLRQAEPQAPAAPALDAGPPPTEPVDYYAMLGLMAEHLMPVVCAPAESFPRGVSLVAVMIDGLGYAGEIPLRSRAGPPKPEDINAAVLARERALLLSAGYSAEEREARLADLEIARRILCDDQRRSSYDMLLLGFRQGLISGGRLDTLRHLQDLVRADIAEERGEQISSAEAAALLKQGLGYLNARLPREAIEPLRRAVGALPQSAEAHGAYARAILQSEDPLALGGHMLRQALRSLDALASLGKTNEHCSALACLCRGLLARDAGDQAIAADELRRAAELDSQLVPTWHGLAALALARSASEEALGYCRRALSVDPRDERALVMAAGACLRGGRAEHAREFAVQIALARGAGWTAEAVIHELGG